MSYMWIVVADAAVAKIYSTNKGITSLDPVEEFECEEARLHDRDLTSDRAGRSFDSFGSGRHETSAATGPREQLAIRFAKTISDYLDQGRIKNDYDQLIIVAEPKFLGLLGNAFDSEVSKLVLNQHSKDFTKHKAEEIRQYLLKQGK